MSLILIAEDSMSMAEATRDVLEKSGHEALTASTQAEALCQCQERKPALVLTEYGLEEGDGLGLLESLMRQEPDLQVIMASGFGGEETAARALALGAWAYVVKTESYLEELPGLVNRAIMAKASARAEKDKDFQRRRLEAQNELAGWLAHNFKNILAATVGSLSLIDFGNPDQPLEKRLEYMRDCRESLDQAIGLLEQMREMTKEGAGEAEKLVVAEMVDEAWGSAKAKVLAAAEYQGGEEAGARIKTFMDNLPFLNATRSLAPQFLNRRDIKSVLEALLQNALEAVTDAAAPRILVRGEIKGGFMEVVVKDNGRGMNEKVRQHALEPLFSTKSEVGVGLGLSLVNSLVTRHGGTLSFETAPSQGLAARFSWAV